MKAYLKEKLYYLKAAVFHPFDAFYEIRFRGRGSVPLAAVAYTLIKRDVRARLPAEEAQGEDAPPEG